MMFRLALLVGPSIPTGQVCGWCKEPIDVGDIAPMMGVPVHVACGVRSIAGSVQHQMLVGAHPPEACQCEDDPKLSAREAAIAAYRFFRAQTEDRNGGWKFGKLAA